MQEARFISMLFEDFVGIALKAELPGLTFFQNFSVPCGKLYIAVAKQNYFEVLDEIATSTGPSCKGSRDRRFW